MICVFYYQTTYYVLRLIFKTIKFYDFSYMEDQEELQQKLAEYQSEHQALDGLIESAVNGDQPVNLLHMQQLKKKKLWLKDMIQKIESALIDDIIA